MRISLSRTTAIVAVLAIAAPVVVFVPAARAAIVDAMSCAQSAPCLEWDNTGSGDAVKGVSTKGNALHGQTKFKSAGKPSGKAGVFGEDVSTSGNLDSGVLGSSTNGAGVTGMSAAYNAVQGFASGGASGVYGQNSFASGFGVAGRNTSTTHDNGGAGVLADGGPQDDGLHAYGTGSHGNAVYAYSTNASSIVLNQGPSDEAPELLLDGTALSHDALESTDSQGNDVFTVSTQHFVGISGELDVEDDNDVAGIFQSSSGNSAAPLWLFAGTTGQNDGVLNLFDSSGNQQLTITDIGDIFMQGEVFTGGICSTGCMVGNKQVRRVAEYAASEAEPTIEDNGEGALVGGRAYVALDSKFASVIDTTAAYLVTVTPEGDCDGLYVTGRTPTGFVVREIHGGRSNVGFAYRIVAKKFGEHAARLPMMPVKHVAAPVRQRKRG